MTPCLVLVGQPEHRRTQRMRAALARLGWPAPHVFDYADLLASPAAFLDAAADAIAIKFDSPGGEAATQAAFAQRGRAFAGSTDEPVVARAYGELADRHLWHAGFADLLMTLGRTLPDARWLNAPDDILRMCDKWQCQQALRAAVADMPPLLGRIDDHAELRALLDASGHDHVFVKTRYGSSAAGVVAYRRHRDGREVAYSTAGIEIDAGRACVVSRLAIRRYTKGADIAALIDALALQDCYVEAWVPKPRAAGMPGHHFDLRVIAFDGEARQRVARVASGPMTNLHLGNRREAADALLDAATLDAVDEATRIAARAFPASRSIGFDLIPSRGRFVFLEANAFGDDLQDVTRDGRDACDDQVEWMYRDAMPPNAVTARKAAHA